MVNSINRKGSPEGAAVGAPLCPVVLYDFPCPRNGDGTFTERGAAMRKRDENPIGCNRSITPIRWPRLVSSVSSRRGLVVSNPNLVASVRVNRATAREETTPVERLGSRCSPIL